MPENGLFKKKRTESLCETAGWLCPQLGGREGQMDAGDRLDSSFFYSVSDLNPWNGATQSLHDFSYHS